MSKQININDETYRKFQAALLLTGHNENYVVNALINQYIENALKSALPKEQKEVSIAEIAAKQKQLFTKWFRSLTRNGRLYSNVTVSGYTGRIESACNDPVFSSVPFDNLFKITDLEEFIYAQNEIKNCPGYAEFDARSHNGFTAALKKYEEFLRLQANGPVVIQTPQEISTNSNIHRWTYEEDLICCRRFLKYYVISKSSLDIASFLRNLSKDVPNVSEGSLRMKIQNIKFLVHRAGLTDSSTIKWLNQYSMQCERAFYQALRELNLQ